MRFPRRQFVGALAIVLMALSSAAPRSYTHAHEPTTCREHAHAPGAAHRHAHPHCHRHCHATGDEHASQPTMVAPHAHRHVFWWGLELVLAPLPADDSGAPASELDGKQLQSLRPHATQFAVDASASPLVLPPLAPVVLTFPAPKSAAIARVATARAECNLLCDAARHERSGVQLA